jgi:hypothetical protein
MSKPRKKYRPKPVHLNAVQRAMESVQVLPKHDTGELKAIVRQAFADFTTGQDCAANWKSMADALNVAEALSDIGICSDATSRETIAAGASVLGAVAARHAERNTWALKADEFKALSEGLWLHRVQLDHCSLGEYQRAVTAVAKKTRQALAGNAGQGVQVVCV